MGAHSNLGVFSNAQVITAAVRSENYIDMVAVRSQVGVGKPIYLCIRTSAVPAGGTVDSLSIELRQDAHDDMASPDVVCMPLALAGGAEVVQTDARLATAGAWIYRGSLPYECDKRYVDLYYNNTTQVGTFTIDAWLDTEPPSDFGVQVLESPVGNP